MSCQPERNRKGEKYRGAAVGGVAALLLLPFVTEVPAAPRTHVILAFGDSLVAGLGISPKAAFPSQLEARLVSQGDAVRVINAGVSGDTTAGGLARIERSLADRPDIVIMELGANDALRGIQPAIVRANLDAMITRIQGSGAKLMLTGMRAPPNWGEDYRRSFDRIYPELARTHGVPLYPFFLEGVAMNPELNQPDGLHPNTHGVAALIDRIAPIVLRLIAEVGAPAEENISVLTVNGIVLMTLEQYERYISKMGHLPILSKSYVFGHRVTMPMTDKNGHIHVSDDQTLPGAAGPILETPRRDNDARETPQRQAKPQSPAAAPATSGRALSDRAADPK